MTTAVEDSVASFEALPETEKRFFVTIVLRHSLDADVPSLSDDELTLAAEELFLELDRREEAENAES